MKQNVLLYALAAAGGVILTLFAYCGYQEWQNGKLRDQVAEQTALANEYKQTADRNGQSFEECTALNIANAAEADRQRRAAEKAAERASLAAAQHDETVERMEHDFAELRKRATQNCPGVTDPDFLDRLYGEAGY